MRTTLSMLISTTIAVGCLSPGDDDHGVELRPGQGADWSAPVDDGPSDPEFPDDEVTPRHHLVRLIGAGDISSCSSSGDSATAALLDHPDSYGTVFTVGDNVYPDGTAQEFASCYEPTWGRHKSRTRPSIGNHDFHTNAGAPYYSYFGANAGPAGQGWYSYHLGGWLVIALNTNCDYV